MAPEALRNIPEVVIDTARERSERKRCHVRVGWMDAQTELSTLILMVYRNLKVTMF